MFGLLDLALILVFATAYLGIFYNLPVLAAGLRSFRKAQKQPKSSETKLPDSLPFISVVVPVKNEHEVIGRLLDALSNLNYPAGRMETIVVDDGSADGTPDICKSYSVKMGNLLVLRREVSKGKGCALNYGVEHSKGDLIAIFDADNVPEENALMNAARYFEDSKVAAVQGRILSINSKENMLTEFISYEEAVWCEAYLRGKDALNWFVHLKGCGQFIRKEVLVSSGGFDETTLAEDMELSARLTKLDYTIKYASDIRTWQETPADVRSFLRQRTRWFRGHMQVAMKYGRLLSHVNRKTVDAELTLLLPFVAIASLFTYSIGTWAIVAALPFDSFWRTLMSLSTVFTTAMVVLVGLVLVFKSKPRRIRSLMWLPFVFGYWVFQVGIAMYAALLIVTRRPSRWVKTTKSGTVMNPEFLVETEKITA